MAATDPEIVTTSISRPLLLTAVNRKGHADNTRELLEVGYGAIISMASWHVGFNMSDERVVE